MSQDRHNLFTKNKPKLLQQVPIATLITNYSINAGGTDMCFRYEYRDAAKRE